MHKSLTLTLAVSMVLLSGSVCAETARYGETVHKGEYDSYISKDGTEYKIGDTLKIGVPQGGNQTFTYVSEKFGILTLPTPCPARCVGLKYKIVSLRAGGEGQGFRMWSRLEPAAGGHGSVIVNFEAALESGELVGRGYTSDQALAELKKWKDKLDLGLVTAEEYEVKKQELSKYIQ